MDWTGIITAIITAFGAVLGAYIAASKANSRYVAVMEVKFENMQRDIAELKAQLGNYGDLVREIAVINRDIQALWRVVDSRKGEKEDKK